MDFLRERIGEILRQLEPFCYPLEKTVEAWQGKQGDFPVTDRVSEDTSDWEWISSENSGGKMEISGILGGRSGARFGLTARIRIPEEMEGMPVELAVSTGREGEWDATNPQMAAYLDGRLVQGMDVNHRTLRLTEAARPGQQVSVFLSVYTGERGSIREWNSKIRAVDSKVRKLYYDLLVPWQCLELMEEDSREYGQLLRILNDAVNLLDFRSPGGPSFAGSVEQAEAFLTEAYAELPVSEVTASCIGHTHIDVAWLWTLQVTQEKAARSFSTVLNLMDRYPDYQFMSSQPQLYLYVKRNQPRLYDRIREKVQEGRWEPEGAMFLEADCNLTSGESLVRQCLYGKKFFREEFGTESEILWLPDVFGYSAALPQIMEKCGIHSFMTTKISWNETNQIPYDTFWWEGIDGTRVLTHFITTRDYQKGGRLIGTSREFTTGFTTNYNGAVCPSQVKGAWQRYQQKTLNDNVLISFGYGDGGGGPTEEMLETALRLKDGHFGCPAVKQEHAGAFFRRLHETAEKETFPVWSGELYLEYHRGTYTSMAENKKANRKGEFGLLNAETWSALAETYAEMPYPGEALAEGWEILMRNQFHDILPGSSIEEVYQDSRKEYAHLQEITEKLQEDALGSIAARIPGEPDALIVFNANGTAVDGIVEIPEEKLPEQWKNEKNAAVSGSEIRPLQLTEQGNLIFRAVQVPSKGWKTYRLLSGELPEAGYSDFFCTETETVTPFCHLKWNDCGQICSFYDSRAGRELLKPGTCANVLMTYEDKPHQYDNWNIFEYYKEKQWPVENLISRQVTEAGPVRMKLELTWEYLNSRITETFSFYRDSPRIDIHARIDWQEDQLLLKALFPLELNTREAVYEIQYGNVKRSTVKNTSWDRARFEVCFQKWLDLSEYDYGVSFLSDCKYGVSIEENEVGLTLLKSGCYPNPHADRGIHEFVYAIFPHEGSWQEAGTVREAYALNNPLRVQVREDRELTADSVPTLPGICGEVQTEDENIIAEVLKRSEDGKAEVVRLYECWNRRTRTELIFGRRFHRIVLCNMLEEEERVLAEESEGCTVEFRPFEIVTLKLY
ncbi:MAG: glycoside hydrolase family 38 C-terminal domain-containing protein [Candidatus Limivivens sp.]|nr:glycoside hydrolase family 38 C-terminal domain-containing protein [Candidatus Limivivens sp.]